MIELRLLGSVELRRASGEVLQSVLVQPKRVALLAYLAIARPRGFHRRDELLALFWPEFDDHHARGSLRNTLYRLRTYVGDDVIIGRGAHEVAVSRDLWCDVVAFEEAIASGRDAEAMELYRGDLLIGFFVTDGSADFEQWVDAERARLAKLAVEAAWRLSDAAAQSSESAIAVAWAQRALQLNPSDETGVRRLMHLLHGRGDRAGAIGVYEKFAEQLARDFAVEPDADTQQLAAAIRASRNVSSAVPLNASGEPMSLREPLPRRSVVASLVAVFVLAVATIAYWPRGPATEDRAGVAGGNVGELGPVSSCCELPVGRSHASAAMDSKRNVMVVFGGRLVQDAFDDLWALEGAGRPNSPATWTRWRPAGTPPSARWGHSAAYDSLSDRMIMFGGALGFSAPCSNELWLLTNASGRHGERRWQRLAPRGSLPAPRAEHSAVYDEKENRLIVFGGHDCIAPRFEDVWVLHDANGMNGTPRWEQVAVDSGHGPGGRSAHGAVYDAATNRMLVSGGHDGDGTYLGGVWALSNANGTGGRSEWSVVAPPQASQTLRSHHVVGYDASHDRLMLGTGSDPTGGTRSDVWLLEGTRSAKPKWRQLGPFMKTPLLRLASSYAYDPKASRVVLFGGMMNGAIYQDSWTLTF